MRPVIIFLWRSILRTTKWRNLKQRQKLLTKTVVLERVIMGLTLLARREVFSIVAGEFPIRRWGCTSSKSTSRYRGGITRTARSRFQPLFTQAKRKWDGFISASVAQR